MKTVETLEVGTTIKTQVGGQDCQMAITSTALSKQELVCGCVFSITHGTFLPTFFGSKFAGKITYLLSAYFLLLMWEQNYVNCKAHSTGFAVAYFHFWLICWVYIKTFFSFALLLWKEKSLKLYLLSSTDLKIFKKKS